MKLSQSLTTLRGSLWVLPLAILCLPACGENALELTSEKEQAPPSESVDIGSAARPDGTEEPVGQVGIGGQDRGNVLDDMLAEVEDLRSELRAAQEGKDEAGSRNEIETHLERLGRLLASWQKPAMTKSPEVNDKVAVMRTEKMVPDLAKPTEKVAVERLSKSTEDETKGMNTAKGASEEAAAADDVSLPEQPPSDKPTDLKSPPEGFADKREFDEPLLGIRMIWSGSTGYWLSDGPARMLNWKDIRQVKTFCRQLNLGTEGKDFPKGWEFQATSSGYLRVVPQSVPWEDIASALPELAKTAQPPLEPKTPGENEMNKARQDVDNNQEQGETPALDVAEKTARTVPLDSGAKKEIVLANAATESAETLPGGDAAAKQEASPQDSAPRYEGGVNLPVGQVLRAGPSTDRWVFRFDEGVGEWRTSDYPLASSPHQKVTLWAETALGQGLIKRGWTFVRIDGGNIAVQKGSFAPFQPGVPAAGAASPESAPSQVSQPQRSFPGTGDSTPDRFIDGRKPAPKPAAKDRTAPRSSGLIKQLLGR